MDPGKSRFGGGRDDRARLVGPLSVVTRNSADFACSGVYAVDPFAG